MYSIAIDGPAGAGKTTQAKAVAKELNFLYVDTGALYRAIAFGLNAPDLSEAEVKERLSGLKIKIQNVNGEQHVYLNGEDVTGRLRTEKISMLASKYSAMPCVRAALLSLQRMIAESSNVVMEGRDIGTVVLPNATLKIFLTAMVEVRAIRRVLQIGAAPEELAEIRSNLKKRDEDDSSRKEAPLKKAEDAIRIDCSDIGIQDVTNQILKFFAEKTAK